MIHKMNQANLYMLVSRLTNHNQPNIGTLQYETAHFMSYGSIKMLMMQVSVVISKPHSSLFWEYVSKSIIDS